MMDNVEVKIDGDSTQSGAEQFRAPKNIMEVGNRVREMLRSLRAKKSLQLKRTTIHNEIDTQRNVETPVQTNENIYQTLITNADKEKYFLHAVVSDRKPLDSTHDAELIEFEGGGLGIFKPAEGEKFVAETIEPGTYYKRERAAYLVDQALKFGLVPPTVIREIDGREGSLQEFIPGAHNISEDTSPFTPQILDKLYNVWIFDGIINNGDRFNDGILKKRDDIYATDHGQAFNEDIPGHANDYYDRPAPQDLIKNLSDFTQDSARKDALRTELLPLLSQREVDACFARIVHYARVLTKKGSIGIRDNPTFFPDTNTQ